MLSLQTPRPLDGVGENMKTITVLIGANFRPLIILGTTNVVLGNTGNSVYRTIGVIRKMKRR